MSDKASGRTVDQGSTMLETLYGSLSGMAFGLVSPLASQPFDTLKTKMQAESRFASQSMGNVARQVVRAEGIAGLFRGIVPIVASTGVQKSALFSANAGARDERHRGAHGADTVHEPAALGDRRRRGGRHRAHARRDAV